MNMKVKTLIFILFRYFLQSNYLKNARFKPFKTTYNC